MKHSNRIRGARAVRNGSRFESLFEIMCSLKKVVVTPIPDGCRVTNEGLRRVKTPFDYVVSWADGSALIDTKTVLGKRFAPSDIAQHQFEAMHTHMTKGSMIGGYVIWFREPDKVCFLSALVMNDMLRERAGRSWDELVVLGSGESFDVKLIKKSQEIAVGLSVQDSPIDSAQIPLVCK